MVRNCRVLKQSELDALTKALDSILKDWCQDWLPKDCLANVKDTVVLRVQDENNKQHEAEYLAAWSNDSWCAVLSDCHSIELVGKVLLGYKTEKQYGNITSGPITSSIVDDALLELTQRVVAGGNISIDAVPVKLSKKSSIPVDAFQSWSGALLVSVDVAGIDICLMLSSSVIDNLIPIQPIDIPRILIKRNVVIDGVKDKKINAEVRLKPANLSIGTLANLSPGDVIVLEHKIDNPFRLIIEDSNKNYVGHLGMKNGKYAIKLDPIEHIAN